MDRYNINSIIVDGSILNVKYIIYNNEIYFYNENDQITLGVKFDYITLTEHFQSTEMINDQLVEIYDKFKEYWKNIAKDNKIDDEYYTEYEDKLSCEITRNSKGIFSILFNGYLYRWCTWDALPPC